jgi:hypothetical protein
MTMADRTPGEDALALHLGTHLAMAAKHIDRGSDSDPQFALIPLDGCLSSITCPFP